MNWLVWGRAVTKAVLRHTPPAVIKHTASAAIRSFGTG